MKATTAMNDVFDECRAATTADALGAGIDKIEGLIGALHAERALLDGQLGEAVVAGRDAGKIHSAMAALNEQVMLLEAARGGFSQKQADMRKAEDAAELSALQARYEAESAELTAVASEKASAINSAISALLREDGLVKQHNKTSIRLEALTGKMVKPAVSYMRAAVGDDRTVDRVPTVVGASEYAARARLLLHEALTTLPGQLRARDGRRQRGRFAESQAFKDQAVENLLAQARGIEKKAG